MSTKQETKREKKKITQPSLCQIVTSRPSLGTQSHLSSSLSIVRERGWVGYHEAFDAGGRQRGTPVPDIGVPTGHDTVNLGAFEVGYFASGGHVVGVTTKAALSLLGTVDGTMVGEDFPTFVAEAGVQGGRAAVRVRAGSLLERGFFSENSPKHACGDSGVDESMSGGEEVVMVVMKLVLKGFGTCGEFFLQGRLGMEPRNIRG